MRRGRDAFDRRYGDSLFMTELVRTLGIVDLVATPVGVVVLLTFRVAEEAALDGAFVALLVMLFIGGVTLGGLLLGVSALMSYADALTRGHKRTPRARAEVDQPVTYTAHADASTLSKFADREASIPPEADGEGDARVLSLLSEIRDLTLMPSEERKSVSDRIRAHRERRAAEMVVDAINVRQIGKARLLLREATAAYGTTPTFERLAEKIQEADVRNESLDYARTRRLVEEAIGEGNWALAEEYARAAHNDHADSARCRKLWDDARRARLHAHVQESANHHHWNEALAAAEEFLERFPESIEAEALREQVGTLRANAEIQQRKHYEDRFKELISGRQYDEALRIARHVIEHFPGSPQAEALREQVPVLQKRLVGT
jgi:hypothetical protein